MTAGSRSWKEGAGIYDVLENRAEVSNSTVYNRAKSGGIYGWAHRKEAFATGADWRKREAATKGVINGMLDAEDYSGGGYFWQGVDFNHHYDGMHAYESFYLVGFDFTDNAHDIWKMGDHKSGEKSYNYVFGSTGVQRKTTFFKYTDEYIKANSKPKQWP